MRLNSKDPKPAAKRTKEERRESIEALEEEEKSYISGYRTDSWELGLRRMGSQRGRE